MREATRRGAVLLCVSVLPFVFASCVEDPAKNKQAATVNDAVEIPPATTDGEDGTEAPERAAPPEPEGTTYTIDTDASSITFTGSKVTGTHSGGWSEYEGSVVIPEGDFTEAKVHVTIDMASTFSDDADLTEKLKGPDFFDIEKYPESTFQSTSIVETDDGYNVSGNLTLHGVTKNLTFPVWVELDADKLIAEAEFSFNRKDFDIVYDGLADDAIRDKVLMLFYIEATPNSE